MQIEVIIMHQEKNRRTSILISSKVFIIRVSIHEVEGNHQNLHQAHSYQFLPVSEKPGKTPT